MNNKHYSAFQAISKAQEISFAPVTFQACYAMREMGLLSALNESSTEGLNLDVLVEKLGHSRYSVELLLDFGVHLGVIEEHDGQFHLGKVGYYLLKDEMTKVNMDFVQDVCYEGLFHLKDCLVEGKPHGLKHFGDWPTVYEGLSSLPEKVQKSWFAFDHLYSDESFDQALPFVFLKKPKLLLDVGGNTGKWATKCVTYRPRKFAPEYF